MRYLICYGTNQKNYDDHMNVLLVNPPTGKYMRDERCQVPVDSRVAEPPRPPMDLAYIAALLEQAGVKCMIKDYPMEGGGWPDLENDIRYFEPDVMVINTTTPTLYSDLAACKVAKHINPNIVTVAKGAHFLFFDVDVLNGFQDLDITIRGEPEITIKEITSGAELRHIKGITFRLNGNLVRNENRPLLDELDNLPYPARHLLNNDLYRTPDTDEPITFIYTSRGCPGTCIFCAAGLVSGRKLRIRSIGNVIGEIEECIKRYRINNFFFRADTFTWDKDWVINFCKEIISRNIKIRWGTNSRVDTIDDQRIAWMRRAGCSVIGFGAESGNQEILYKMGKDITLPQIEGAVALCKKHNVESFLHFVIGVPWDTQKTVSDTMHFIRKIRPSFIEVNIAYPIPGTGFYDMCVKDKLLVEEVTGHNHILPATRTYYLSREELMETRKQILRDYYFNFWYIADRVSKLRSPRMAWNYCKAARKLFLNIFK